MPKYDSPLGSRQFQGPPMREFSVSDESSSFVPDSFPKTIVNNTPQPTSNPPYQFDQRTMQSFQDFQQQMQPPMPGAPRQLSEVEQDMLAAKKAKREGKERLSKGARRRIEMLIGMTRMSKELDLDGQFYKLQTLSSRELRDAITAAAEFDGSVQFMFETRKQLLARSLVVVAGVELDQFLNSHELEDKLNFIEEMDHGLLLRLYNEYNLLAKDSSNKYAIKTEEQVKEVVADLKK